MDKTSQKVTKDKGPKRVDARPKGRENFMKKMKENILNMQKVAGILPIQAMKLSAILPIPAIKLQAQLTMQAMKLPASSTLPPRDQMILMSMAFVYLLSFPLVFVDFFAYNTFQPNNKELINEK